MQTKDKTNDEIKDICLDESDTTWYKSPLIKIYSKQGRPTRKKAPADTINEGVEGKKDFTILALKP